MSHTQLAVRSQRKFIRTKVIRLLAMKFVADFLYKFPLVNGSHAFICRQTVILGNHSEVKCSIFSLHRLNKLTDVKLAEGPMFACCAYVRLEANAHSRAHKCG